MQSHFARALTNVLAHEGGYSNNRHDPGGATMQGVTQRVYDAWRRLHGKVPAPVRFIGADEVAAIYKAQYWDAIRGDDLPSGVDNCLFDEAVNSGPGFAAKELQRVLRLKVDGSIGAVTIDKARGVNDRRALINTLCDRRLTFLRALANWKHFGKGWTARVSAVRRESIGLI